MFQLFMHGIDEVIGEYANTGRFAIQHGCIYPDAYWLNAVAPGVPRWPLPVKERPFACVDGIDCAGDIHVIEDLRGEFPGMQ